MTTDSGQNPSALGLSGVAKLNAKYQKLVAQALDFVRDAREFGFDLIKWKDEEGRGNWMEAFKASPFEFSLDTAENLMRLTKLSVEEIEGVKSIAEALRLLRAKRKAKPAKDKRLADKQRRTVSRKFARTRSERSSL